MEIKVSDFKRALEIVKPGVATAKTTMEQVTSFAFTKKNVISYNDEICIYHPLADLELQGAIEAELLYKFLSKVKTERISLEINDYKVVMKSGRSKAEFSIDSEIKLPLDDAELTEKGKWHKLPDNFIEAITMAKDCVAKDRIQVKLTCVHITKKGVVESSDGFRILNYKLGEKLPIDTMLIPASSINTVIQINPVKIATSKSWVHFKNEEGTVISCRIINEVFPQTEQLLEKGKNGVELEFPKELISTLSTAELFAENSMVQLTLSKKKLTVSSEGQTARFKEELDLPSKVEPFAFKITPYLLMDILKQTTTCTIYNERLLFKNNNWVYMTALTMIEE